MGKLKGCFIMPHPPLIVPEIGQGEEMKVKNTVEAMKQVSSDIRELEPDTVVLITPHGPIFRDAIAITELDKIEGDFGAFGRMDIAMGLNIDTQLTAKIIDNAFMEGIPVIPITEKSIRGYDAEGKLDHGAMVPLYYLNKKYGDYRLVHITYGMLPKDELYNFGTAIKKAIDSSSSDAVIIASGDLSHRLSDSGPYSYSPRGAEFDNKLLKLLEDGDVKGILRLDKELVKEAGECGLRSFYILLGAMDKMKISGELLSYEGTFGVGYGVMRFCMGKAGTGSCELPEEDSYVELARKSLTHYLKYGEEMALPDYIPEEMLKIRRGVFVSFKKEGNLRGCIGTILPTSENVAREIVRNSVEAGIHDPRFRAITLDEIESLDVSVDELLEPELALKSELDPKEYGVIVSLGIRRGLLLPDLEGVDTVEHQLNIALQKAGIGRDEEYTIEKFKVIRHR